MRNRLTPQGRWLRLGLAAAILLALVGLSMPCPVRPFLPCGFHAVSGLPCLFCGGTRAARAILHGDLRTAIYLNLLAFPALAFVAAAWVVLVVEAVAARSLAPWEAVVRRLSRLAPAFILSAVVWWGVHIYLALRTPKPELVNFHNPIAVAAEAMVQRSRPQR